MRYRIQVGGEKIMKMDIYTTKDKEDKRTEEDFIRQVIMTMPGLKSGHYIKISRDGEHIKTFKLK